MISNRKPVLEVKDLTVSFSRYNRGWNKEDLKVIHALDVTVAEGEILAVVGSSGSGKSLLAHAILDILPPNAKVTGSMKFEGSSLTDERKALYRGKEIVLIPQSVDFLDPLMKVDRQVMGVKGSREKMKKVFNKFGLGQEVEGMYPFQLSGGMARRVLISTAMVGEPKLVIADEPTPGLEVSMAMETLYTFREMADRGCGVLLITHDVDLALQVADRIAVFYAGTTVEVCPVEDFKKGGEDLRHPYSKAFVKALPQNDFAFIDGAQPYATRIPEGCVFADRCSMMTEDCRGHLHMRDLRGGDVRCIHAK